MQYNNNSIGNLNLCMTMSWLSDLLDKDIGMEVP